MAQWLDRVKYGNGKDGAPTTPIAGHGICSGTAGSTTLAIYDAHAVWQTVAGDVVLIHQSQGTGAGQWELNVATDTLGTGNHTMAYPLSYTYGTGAQIMRVAQFTGGTLSANLTPTYAWNGSTGGIIALMCNGDLTISGSINVSGRGFRGGSAMNSTNSKQNGYQGEGYSGTGTQATTVNGNGAGGGGTGGLDGTGGGAGGGNGAAGTNGSAGEGSAIGVGGLESGNTGLTNITFGGGGASGANGPRATSCPAGGVGSGIIMIFTKSITTSSGTIALTGVSGGTGSGQYYVGSGGGAGGSCLIKCQTAVLGTNKITAAGGGGGTGNNPVGGSGGAGAVGRIHIDYSDSISGTTTPTLDSTQVTTLKSQVYGGMI